MGPCLSGAVFLNNLKVFRERFGDDVVARAIDGLTEAQRAEVDAAVSAAWLRAETIDATYVAICKEADVNLRKTYGEVVRAGVQKTLRSVWKLLLRLTTDAALLARTPAIYERGHSVGKLRSEIRRPGDARIWLTDWPDASDLRLQGVAYGIWATLEVAGRSDIDVTWDRTPDGAEYYARWKA